MANRRHSHGLFSVGQLVEDPISAYSKGVEPPQLAPERVSGSWFALEQPEGILDCIDQGPAQFQQLATRAAGKDESRHRSTSCCAAFGELAAKLGESNRLAPLELGKSRLQGGEGVGV